MSSPSSSLFPSSPRLQEVANDKNTVVEPSTSDQELNSIITRYLKYERVVEHRKYLENLVQANNVEQLRRLVGKRLTFGTAGIRGSMGAGFGQMNDLVIIQTSQGLASYLLELDPRAAKEQGVIIGFDARHNSSRFARLTALAFLQKSIPVYFCDHIIPTPLIAFGVKHFGCRAGIMITASHNPKNDNGYKVYFSNGAQILSPHDKNIQEHIMRDSNQQPWPKAWDHELLSLKITQQQQQLPVGWSDIFFRIHGDLCKNYFTYIENLVHNRRQANQSSNIGITYTTMHGVGHNFLSRALDIAGFEDAFPVESQKKPDPEFSTVKFPNPEEAGALDLAFETAKHANSNLILANDPDADRCAAALYDPKSNYKRVLNGNEIGSLLGWWIWHCHVSNDDTNDDVAATTTDDDDDNSNKADGNLPTPAGSANNNDNTTVTKTSMTATSTTTRPPSSCYMISTAVSSKFLQSMARIEGFQFIETLTGFKYMGNLAEELMKEGDKIVLFAYEEAIGYMVDSSILDKDGISAAIQLAQCAAFVSTTFKRTLEQHLDWLYSVYGFHYNLNSYFICSDSQVISKIFSDLQSNYPKNFCFKPSDSEHQQNETNFKVTRVRDLNNGFDSGAPNKKAILPCSSSSYMVTFFIEDDITLTIRTSGTEPKIKYYSEIVAKLPNLSPKALGSNNFNEEPQARAKESAKLRLRNLVQAAIEHCLRPNHYDLEPADG